jgi:hypothetical protein
MSFFRLSALLLAIALAGCANSRQTYVSKHPELTPAQRQLFVSGRVPSGDSVAGLTRDQVAIILGNNPDSFDKANGEDVWVYRKNKPVESSPDNAPPPSASTSNFRDAPQLASPDSPSHGPSDTIVVTKVFFKGDIATHAQTSEER